VYEELEQGCTTVTTDPDTQETLDEGVNDMLNAELRFVKGTQHCNNRFHSTCLGRPAAAGWKKKLTSSKKVFEDGTGLCLEMEQI